MPINRNALIRMRTIDACLRRRNRLWTIEDLQEACEDALYDLEGVAEISTRTIRRDLQLMRSDKLGYNAPIVVRDKKYYTYEDPDYSITQLPLTDRDVAELSSALDIIRHFSAFSGMDGQEDIIARLQDRATSAPGRRRVVYLETNDRLKGLSHLGELYECTSGKCVAAVTYRSFTAKGEKLYRISPYILKEFNNRWFVIGHCAERRCVMTFALDRIVAVRKDPYSRFEENIFFDPEQYLAQMVGVSRSVADTPAQVVLRVDAATTPYIITKPLHPSQTVEQQPDGTSVATLSVIINLELVRLLLGFGMHITVLRPEGLRDSIIRHLSAAMKNYGQV